MTKIRPLLSFLFYAAVAGAGLGVQTARDEAIMPAIPASGHAKLIDDTYSYQDHLRRYARRKYGPLMARLQDRMSEDKHERLWGILEVRELSVNGRKREGDLPAVRTSFDQQIRAELGDDIADSVSEYINTISARGLLARVNMLLLCRGNPLSPEQIDMLSLDMTRHSAAVPRNVGTIADIRTFTEQRLARDGMVLASAKKYLSPDQLEALSEEMEFQVSAIKIGMLNALERRQQTK